MWTNVPAGVTSPYALTGLTNNTFYEWQVRTDCQPDYGSSQIFQTACNAPSGLRTEALATTSVRLRWNDSGDGVGYVVQWRVAGTSAWNSISGITTTNYLLTGLTNYTDYEWQVGSQCSDVSNFQITDSFKTINECPHGLYTVRAGSWDDPTVWSCQRVPTSTDPVQLNHAIILPNAYMTNVLTIRYETGARLSFGLGAMLRLGN